MEFRVGQINAKCPGCGGTQFKIPEDEHSGPRMNYVCAACGKTEEYAKLIMQIGREAQKQRKTRLSGERADRVRSGLS
jgi:DNA-directed RNA polymerase subunit RPC12/RpoP